MKTEMTPLRLGDVLLFKPVSWGILLPLVRWLVEYDHVALYYTDTKRGLPLIIESIGRGVLIRSLLVYAGRQVRLMRPRVDDETALRIAKEAERLADNPDSWYGYFDIPRYVIPKLILAKIGRLLPLRWALTLKLLTYSYRHNSFHICSELVAEAYRRAGVPLVGEDTIPLPDDIAKSEMLESLGDVVVPAPDRLESGTRLMWRPGIKVKGKKFKHVRLWPIVLELVGIATVGVGIGIELAAQANIGYLLITIGSLLVAAGGVIWGKFMRGGH